MSDDIEGGVAPNVQHEEILTKYGKNNVILPTKSTKEIVIIDGISKTYTRNCHCNVLLTLSMSHSPRLLTLHKYDVDTRLHEEQFLLRAFEQLYPSEESKAIHRIVCVTFHKPEYTNPSHYADVHVIEIINSGRTFVSCGVKCNIRW